MAHATIGTIDGIPAAQTFEMLMVRIWEPIDEAVETMLTWVEDPEDAFEVAKKFYKASFTTCEPTEDHAKLVLATFQDGSQAYIGSSPDDLTGSAVWEHITAH